MRTIRKITGVESMILGINSSDKKRYTPPDYIIVFLCVFALFAVSIATGIKDNETLIKLFMTAALLGVGVYAFRRYSKNKLTVSDIIGIIVAAGSIMRIGYCLYTNFYIRNHDFGMLDANDAGHGMYILKLAEGHLSTANDGQDYHPPFFHMIAAVFYNIGELFYGDIEKAFSLAQSVNCTASCYMLMVFRGFLNEISLKDRYKILAAAIVAVFPQFMLMAGGMNNDMIVTLCMLLCIINTYRWYKNRDMKTIILLALSFGIGMMTKTSCAAMAIVTGPVMIYCLVKDFKKREFKAIIKQLAVFAVISIPLGMWYPIRNYILFDQPLASISPAIGELYRGNVPWYERFFDISLVSLFKQPFANAFTDTSILMYIIRSSLFDEYTFPGMEAAAGMLNIINLCMIIISLAAMIYVLIKYKELDKKFRYGFFMIWIALFGSYVYLNIASPFMCSADFRYIPLTTVMGTVYIAYAMQLADAGENKALIYLSKFAELVSIIWCVMCVAAYI